MGKFQEALYEDLSLYVRQLAWLNTSPERAKIDDSTGLLVKRLSRLDQFRRTNGEDAQPPLPPIMGDAYFFIERLFEVGPIVTAGFGATVITHAEIQAWQHNVGLRLQPLEVKLLRRLSLDYLVELNDSDERSNAPAPWQSPNKVMIVSSMKHFLRELSKL